MQQCVQFAHTITAPVNTYALIITGTKFRRVSSNKDHSRVSTDDILTSSPPSYPDITAYDALMHSAATARPNTRSNNSNRHGGSFDHLLERQSDGEGAPVFSMTGTTSPDSFNQADYDPQAAVHSRSYAHHCRNSGGTRLRGDGSSRHQHRRHSLQYPPSQPPLPPLGHALSPHSSRELFSHSGREVESFTRLRDSMSQDTLEFDYHYRYNGNHSGTLPTLSLQDSHHGDHTRSSRNRERVINDRDLRRHHDVMPTHEAFSHRAILPATGAPVQLSYLSLNPASQESNSRGGDSTVIHHQPLASTVESQRSQSPPDNTQERPGSGVQLHSPLPHNYYPVFFSPESGRLFMSVDGNYKPLPNHVMDVPSIHTGAQVHVYSFYAP